AGDRTGGLTNRTGERAKAQVRVDDGDSPGRLLPRPTHLFSPHVRRLYGKIPHHVRRHSRRRRAPADRVRGENGAPSTRAPAQRGDRQVRGTSRTDGTEAAGARRARRRIAAG